MRRWWGIALGVGAACGFDATAPVDPNLGEMGTTTGGSTPSITTTTAAVPTPGAGTATSTTTSSNPPQGSSGSSGEPSDTTESGEASTGELDCLDDPDCLVSRGLLTRYFLDEANAGQDPPRVEDAAPDPLDLDIIYTDSLAYTEVGGNRGLRWNAQGDNGRASAAVDGSKLAAVDGMTAATIELVLETYAVHEFASRISHVGAGEESGRLTVRSASLAAVELRVNEDFRIETALVPEILDRTVLHVVFDSARVNGVDRAEIYVDGELRTPDTENPPPLGQTIRLLAERYYVLGNREVGDRSFEGVLFYAALYTEALDVEEIEHNAARLQASDDR